jgi:hypothetical protein
VIKPEKTIENLLDAFTAYEEYLQQKLASKQARTSINKLKTGLVRFTLPGWGYPLKLAGRLTPEEMFKGIAFMASVSLLQADQALEVQESVFQRMGEQVSDTSKRVYRSAVRHFIEYCQSLTVWPTYKRPGLPPTAYIYGKPRKVWRHFSIRIEEVPPPLQAELDAYAESLSNRTPPLSPSSIERQTRGVRKVLGWLRITKNRPVEEFTIFQIVPVEALFEETAATKTLGLLREYLDWLKSREEHIHSLKQAFLHFLYLAEYSHHVYIDRSPQPMQPIQALQHVPLVQKLLELRHELDFHREKRVTQRRRLPCYGVTPQQITPEMQTFLDDFLEFHRAEGKWAGRKVKGIRPGTADLWKQALLRMWGYRLKYDPIPPQNQACPELIIAFPVKSKYRQAKTYEELKMVEVLAQEAAEETMEWVYRYIGWLRQERQISATMEANTYCALIAVAKFLHHGETDSLKVSDFQDIPLIQALRAASKKGRHSSKTPGSIDESKKWLDWPDFLQMVQQLKQECQTHYRHGERRSESAIAASVQRFLIVAFFAYLAPDRQRTYRELEVGRTLCRGHLKQGQFLADDEGGWWIHLEPEDYKTGETYGTQWQEVPEMLVPHLEEWLNRWRAVFKPHHNFVFTQKNGKPYPNAGSFGSVLQQAARRLTGKAVTPHMLRHMLITYLKLNGASDAVMGSLAEAMHHSEEMQRRVYDRRCPQQRTQLAQQVVLDLAQGKPLSRSATGRPVTVEALWEDFNQLSPEGQQQLKELLLSHHSG